MSQMSTRERENNVSLSIRCIHSGGILDICSSGGVGMSRRGVVEAGDVGVGVGRTTPNLWVPLTKQEGKTYMVKFCIKVHPFLSLFKLFYVLISLNKGKSSPKDSRAGKMLSSSSVFYYFECIMCAQVEEIEIQMLSTTSSLVRTYVCTSMYVRTIRRSSLPASEREECNRFLNL